MPKAQTGSTTFGQPVFGGSATWATRISEVRANVQQTKIIWFDDLNAIKAGIDLMMDHYHSYTDLYQNAEYGNNGDRATYTVGRNSDGAIPVASRNAISSNFTKGGTVYASDHKAMRDNTVLIQSHQHGGRDQNTA